jgi:hypothetical protein
MLQVALGRLSHIIICPCHPLRCFERCLYRKRRDSIHDVISYRLVDPHSSDSYTLASAHMSIVAATLISMCVARRHSIEHMHDPSTPTTTHKAC